MNNAYEVSKMERLSVMQLDSPAKYAVSRGFFNSLVDVVPTEYKSPNSVTFAGSEIVIVDDLSEFMQVAIQCAAAGLRLGVIDLPDKWVDAASKVPTN